MSLSNAYGFTEKEIKNEIRKLVPDKQQFYSQNGTKCFDTKKECKISYNLESTYQSSLCGTAFDYLARFDVARIAEYNRENSLVNLVAERFFDSTLDFFEIEIDNKYKEIFKINISVPEEILCGRLNSNNYLKSIFDASDKEIQRLVSKKIIKICYVNDNKEIRDSLREGYRQLLEPVNQYVYGAHVVDDILIDVSLVLAKLEQMRRGVVGAVPVSEIFDYDIDNQCVKEELKNMLDSFRKVFLPIVRGESVVVYNPHFGIGSRIIGGADADIYIDGVLYDFKTTLKNGWRSANAAQIIGYYMLDTIAKKCFDSRNQLAGYPIHKVALYKVRYEEIAYFDVADIDIDLIDKTIEDVSRVYLMYNMISLSQYNKTEEFIAKYEIPLTRKEFMLCTTQAKEEMDWYEKHNCEISEFEKERIKKILKAQTTLKEYLDNIDILMFFRKLVEENNNHISYLLNNFNNKKFDDL